MRKEFYTTHEASKLCKVYPSTIINWIKEGLLPAYSTAGGHRRIKRDDLINFMKLHNMPLPEELLKERDKYRILVIDDDPKILKMIETILSSYKNLEVKTAKSGFEAGLLISNWQPDLITLDFLMPQMDGFEVCKKLREDKKTKDIPILAITVLKEDKELKRMFDVGINDHLSKPFVAQELVKKIEKLLSVKTLE